MVFYLDYFSNFHLISSVLITKKSLVSEGHEIDCDVLVQNNQATFIVISDNFPAPEPFFFEQGSLISI